MTDHVTIICTKHDFYLGDSVCRELEKRGIRCRFNWRDAENPERPEYSFIADSTKFIFVFNDEFMTDGALKEMVEVVAKDTPTNVILLCNDRKIHIPEEFKNCNVLDAATGLSLKVIDTLVESVGTRDVDIESGSSEYAQWAAKWVPEETYVPTGIDDPIFCIPQRQVQLDVNEYFVDSSAASASTQRALRYLTGNGVPKDIGRAFALLQKAVTENPDDAMAHYYLGFMCELTMEDPGDMTQAIDNYSKAIELGFTPAKIAKAMLLLLISDPFENGCVAILKDIALGGDVRGNYFLGLLSESRENYDEAFEQYSQAAEDGYPPAQNAIGCLYLEGLGVEQDGGLAFEWFTLAAQNNLPEAKYNMFLIQPEDNKDFELLHQAAEDDSWIASQLIALIKNMEAQEEAAERRRQQREEIVTTIFNSVARNLPKLMGR